MATATAPPGAGWTREGAQPVVVVLADDPASSAGRAALQRVRDAGQGRVGGNAAKDADFVSADYGDAAWVVLNVVSLAAAYGVTVLVWQDGVGSELLFDQPATGVITSWVPIAAFAFLFGLSMDYEVFLLARMREAYDEHGDTDRAVVDGIAHTARLVTSVGLILFLAFVALSTVPAVEVKILATALALGILIDAVVVRSVLAPALVGVLGERSWTLPRPVRRLLGLGPAAR